MLMMVSSQALVYLISFGSFSQQEILFNWISMSEQLLVMCKEFFTWLICSMELALSSSIILLHLLVRDRIIL